MSIDDQLCSGLPLVWSHGHRLEDMRSSSGGEGDLVSQSFSGPLVFICGLPGVYRMLLIKKLIEINK